MKIDLKITAILRKDSQTIIISRPKIADGITCVKLYMLFIIESIALLDNGSNRIGILEN